ncbi:MAG TPA: LacI family transcriptional regulator [Candidatus Alistipes intestinipullorum]|nr:LacI family transcriptional regulator [Candidatus Alistipes intestinipullorum]
MGVLLKDVAKALNLSKATVSWILSGKGDEKGFSEATIKLVKETAAKMGYSPNLLARSLSLGTTHTVALIIPAIGDTFYSQMAQAVEKQAHQRGYTLIISSSESNADKERRLISALRAQQVDGLIIAPSKGEDSAIRRMIKDHYPFVFIDRYYPELETNYVIVDNEGSSREIVQRLIGDGCRRIALMTTDTHLYVMSRRTNGYLAALKEAGIDVDPSLCVGLDRARYREAIVEELDALLARCPDVDGFFFSTHYLALETIRYFIKRGIDYRKRFRFACFHTTAALDILAPEMYVTLMPIEKMGTMAVDILLDNIASKEDYRPQGVVLENTILS